MSCTVAANRFYFAANVFVIITILFCDAYAFSTRIRPFSSRSLLHYTKSTIICDSNHEKPTIFHKYRILTSIRTRTDLGAKTEKKAKIENNEKPWWRDEGDAIIKAAAVEAGADETLLKVDWGPGYITVTVGGGACLSTSEKEDDEGAELDDQLLEGEGTSNLGVENSKGPDITAIARSINNALDGEEGSVGWNVATRHSIDVTTPGATDELSGIMFESYKGFDVIVEAFDKKKNKNIIVEGRLYDRSDDITTINIKGRMKKLKNELISSIRLPKAKKEKGV